VKGQRGGEGRGRGEGREGKQREGDGMGLGLPKVNLLVTSLAVGYCYMLLQ